MSNSPSTGRTVGKIALAVVALALVWWWLQPQVLGARGEALADALQPLIDRKDAEAAPAAQAILANFHETRTIAAQWSGVYWGFTFLAAALSAVAGLVLKVETLLASDKARKDIAAVCSVLAALLITVSTSGDFQRKWQANRVAAAELEHLGYQLLETDGQGARTHMGTVGQILLRRHLAIVGGIEPPRGATSAASASASRSASAARAASGTVAPTASAASAAAATAAAAASVAVVPSATASASAPASAPAASAPASKKKGS